MQQRSCGPHFIGSLGKRLLLTDRADRPLSSSFGIHARERLSLDRISPTGTRHRHGVARRHLPSILASLANSVSQAVTALAVHVSSCIASKVSTIRTSRSLA